MRWLTQIRGGAPGRLFVVTISVMCILSAGCNPPQESAPADTSATESATDAARKPAPRVAPPAGSQVVPRDSNNGPRIELSTLELDLGTVSSKEVTQAEVTVRNTGNADLKLQNPKPSCGCTKATLDDTVVPAGGETKLRIAFDPSKLGFVFESKKLVLLRSNDPVLQVAKLEIRARIEQEFDVEPRQLRFGEVQAGTSVQQTAVFRQMREDPVEITAIEVGKEKSPIGFAFAKRPETEWQTPGRPEYVITATLAADAPPGPFRARCGLVLNFQRLKSFPISAMGEVVTFYKLSTRLAKFQKLEPGGVEKGAMTITADRAFEVSDISVTAADLRIVPRSEDEGKTVIFDLEVAPTAQTGLKRGELAFTVRSGDQSYKEKVRVQGVVTGPPTE